MAAAVDTAYLAASYAIPKETFDTIVDAPTVDLVRSLLDQLAAKARDFDQLKSDKLRADVELENAIRAGESRTRALKTSVDNSLKEIEELRKKLNDEENARVTVETELQNLKSSTTTSSSEKDALETRITTLEASNRDALALVESKSASNDRLSEELTNQHQKLAALKQEIASLEEKNRTLENNSVSLKFREQSLQQEVELLKKNNEWFETELNTRNAEYSKYRKEKSARISELQRHNEDASQRIESLQRTETALRNQCAEINQKAEEAFLKIQQLSEAATKAEESFRIELDSARRLADLQKQSADTARARLQDVQSTLDQTKEDAAEEIGQMQAEVETERSERENAERRVAELELQVEKLEGDLAGAQTGALMPSTPGRGLNGQAGTPGRGGSPSVFSPGSSRTKGGLSFTQLYSEHSEMRAALEAEKRQSARLRGMLDEMLQDLQAKQPEVQELRENHERLEREIIEMSSLLEDASHERDNAKKESLRWQGEVEGLNHETEILRQQLRDLSAQIKLLLVEIQVREEGLDALSAADQMQFERLIRGDIDEDTLREMTDSDRFITQRLTVFRNVNELQEQNAKLLRGTRELSEKLEGKEAKEKENQMELDRRELESLRERVSRHQDEMQSLVTQSQSYIRERDMFRRMLAHRGQIPANSDLASMFGESVGAPNTPPPGGSEGGMQQSSHSKELADYANLVKQLQSHFDSYRQEAATDHATLKEQVDRLAKEKGELQGENARFISQITLAHERYELLRTNLTMAQTENTELQKRSHSLAEAAAKQDLRTQQVAEELVEAKALADSLRNETANLKAEKELWKKIEARLSEDNRSLLDERSRLNKMIADLQNLQNERELADNENRRRLQNRSDSLESELSTIKRKLDNEIEENRKATLRREYEQEQSRTRIDDLMKSLSNVKEELLVAKTQRDQFQARVEELKIELRSAEERAQVLQPRPARESDDSGTETGPADISKEQELSVEVSELKRDLELAKGELETAKTHVEQYKAISQATEEELQSINETHDQYRQETDHFISQKDSKIRDLEQRIEDISSELATTNTELSDLRTHRDEATAQLEEQKSFYESELSRISAEVERARQAAKYHRDDLQAQASIAQKAQQDYENEIVKHAQATTALQAVRSEYNQLKTEVAEARAEAQAARASLAQSEESWSETRDRYERELADLKVRRDDVNAQNELLHQQLENVSNQIASLKQNRGPIGQEESTDTQQTPGLDGLQEVIRYLRQEKEIVDVQYELSIQESKRLRQQLEHAQSQLDQTREKLNQERQSQADKEQNAASHSKLMQTINELNTFRESNTTLRNEARHAQSQLAEKAKDFEQLLNQVQPLEARVRELEAELESKEGEIKLLQEDRDRWQQRTQNILQKYDRVDPAEMEGLKNQIETLTTERDRLVAEKQPMQEKIDAFPEELQVAKDELSKAFQERRDKLIEQSKERDRRQSAKIKEKDAEIQALTDEKNRLLGELSEAREAREALERSQAAQNNTPAAAEPEDTMMENGIEEGQVPETITTAAPSAEEMSALETKVAQAEAAAMEEANQSAALRSQVGLLEGRIQELEQQVANLHQQLETSNNELAQLRSGTALQPADSGNANALEQLRQELVASQQEVQSLKINATSSTSQTEPTSDEAKTIAEQVEQQVASIRTQLDQQHNERVRLAEEQFQKRADSMKKQLSTKLIEAKDKARQEVKQEHDDVMQELRRGYEAELENLKAKHREELEQLSATAANQHTSAITTDGGQEQIKTEAPKSISEWKPSEAEVKDFIAMNPTVKSIVARNIHTKLAQERESLTAKLKEEQENACEAKLEDVRKKADKEKEQAVLMEGKRHNVKVSMAENKSRMLNAKVDVVKQAADETPQRPVGEVWAIAKDAKPAPLPAAQQAQGAPGQQKPSSSNFGQPTPSSVQQQPTAAAQVSPPAQPMGQTSTPQFTFGKPTPLTAPDAPQPNQASSQQSPAQEHASTQQPTNVADQGLPSKPPSQTASGAGAMNIAPQAQQSSSFGQPSRPQPGQAMGTGPAALRGLVGQGQQPPSSIPRGGGMPRGSGRGGLQMQQQQQQPQGQMIGMPNMPAQMQGQNQRGAHSGLPRGGGRGRGQGRGGQHQAGGNMPQGHQGPNSPRGSMNPSARQFIPGNKRPREDGSEGSDVSGGGKRARGGGGGN